MHLLKIRKKYFYLIACKTPKDSYSTAIKKLTALQKKGFIQLIPGKTLKSKLHAFVALDATFTSRQRIAKNKNLEFIARLFGTRQINDALKKAEKEAEKSDFFVLIFDSKKFSEKKALALFCLEEIPFVEFEDPLAIERTALVSLK